MNRGDVYEVEAPAFGRRPAVIVTRQVAIPMLANVTVAVVTSTVRGLRTEVPLDRSHGLDHDSVANCDNLFTVPKTALVRYRGSLAPADIRRLDDALRTALSLD